MVHKVQNADELKSEIEKAGAKLVVIDFFATWCGPCKMIAPELEKLSQEKQDIVFLKVDVDECEDIAAEYNISSMPTFIFIAGGKVVGSFSGANYNKLISMIEQYKP